jgi:hypothetical protein
VFAASDHIAHPEIGYPASENIAVIDSEHDVSDNVMEYEGMSSDEGEREIREEEYSSPEPTRTKRIKSLVHPSEMNENTISSFTSQVPCSSSSSSSTILPQSVILSQMPQTEELTVLSHENLEKFKGQIQLLRRNGVLTNRGVFIHEDVKDIIPFKLKQTGVTDWDVWERWTDERFFIEMLNERNCYGTA